MAEIIKDIYQGTPWYMYALMAVSAGLLVAGFLCPPMGVIDPSVIKGVGVLFGGSTLLKFINDLPYYIEKGAKVKAKVNKDGASVEIQDKTKQK